MSLSTPSTPVHVSTFLRRVLIADATASGATGLLLLLGAGALAPLLGLPETLLRVAGLTLVPFVAIVAWMATRDTLPRVAILTLVAVNVLWVVDSVLLLVAAPVEPNALGVAFVLAQALAVALFAELQYVGLRRSQSTARLSAA